MECEDTGLRAKCKRVTVLWPPKCGQSWRFSFKMQQMSPFFNKASGRQSSWKKLEIVPVVGVLQEDSMKSSGEWIDPGYVENADSVNKC